MQSGRGSFLARILALIGVVALISLIFLFRDQVKNLQQYGYLGIFLVSIIANATIIIPLPGVALTTAMGAIFNPLGVAVAAGLGAALGELTGYLAGFSGQAVVERVAAYESIINWMQKNPKLSFHAILILAFIPNPLFDLAGFAAGALKIPAWKFLVPCAIGKILKMAVFAYAGAYSIDWLIKFIHP